jgi:hypothetical protein
MYGRGEVDVMKNKRSYSQGIGEVEIALFVSE